MARNIILAVLLIIPFEVFAQRSQPQRQPIIDVHMHAYANDARFNERTPNPVTGKALTAATEDSHRKATFEQMDRYNIVKAIVSNGTGSSDVVQRWKSAAAERWGAVSDRIIPSPGFDDPSMVNLDDLQKAYENHLFGAMGEIGAQYAGLYLSDPKFEPYLALAEKMDVPVGVHMGISFPGIPYNPCCRNFRTVFGNPQSIEDVLVRHPKLRLYIMHGGWPYLAETKAIMLVYPQVYVDLAVIDWIIPRVEFHQYLRDLIRVGVDKRLMFGSDQMVWPETIGMGIEEIESAAFLTREEKRNIFCNNAARFLRLDESICSSESSRSHSSGRMQPGVLKRSSHAR